MRHIFKARPVLRRAFGVYENESFYFYSFCVVVTRAAGLPNRRLTDDIICETNVYRAVGMSITYKILHMLMHIWILNIQLLLILELLIKNEFAQLTNFAELSQFNAIKDA